MRPASEIRMALAAALMDGPGTCRQLAQRTQGSVAIVREALNNMVRAGDARKASSVRVPGVKRPVPVYARAVRSVDLAAANESPFVSLIDAWMARPALRVGHSEPMEAAM